MTPSRASARAHPPSPDRTVLGDGTFLPPGLDGVVGDVLVSVLLAAVLAALVGAVLFLLWRALPGA